MKKTVEVQVKKNRFLLQFHHFPSSLKPSLSFSSTVSLFMSSDQSDIREGPVLTLRTFTTAQHPEIRQWASQLRGSNPPCCDRSHPGDDHDEG